MPIMKVQLVHIILPMCLIPVLGSSHKLACPLQESGWKGRRGHLILFMYVFVYLVTISLNIFTDMLGKYYTTEPRPIPASKYDTLAV